MIAPCNGSDTCQNGGVCYDNVGQNVCLCAPGFDGTTCEINIDECLASPCLHNGVCTDAVDDYICDCSDTFYEGKSCEIRTYFDIFF